MKNILYITFYLLVFFSNSFAQLINIPISISDGITSDTLRFGLDPTATNGIDVLLDENELPPLPPAGIFDARFTGTGLTPAVPIGNGLMNDYREGSSNFTGEKRHRIKYQTGSGSVITLNWWNIPLEVSIRVQDIITGTLIDTTFSGSGSYLISNPVGFSSLNLTVNYDFPTLIENEISNSEIPESLTLQQNYPNPFNPVTVINYTLPKADFVKLSVYNSAGQLVEVLLESYKQSGPHSIIFNAIDLTSGIYLYRIEAGEFSVAIRMLLVK